MKYSKFSKNIHSPRLNRPSAPKISLKNLTLNYTEDKNSPFFGPLSLHVNSGQIVSVLGPSGSGKSSLLMAVLGEIKPHQGSIEVSNTSGEKINTSVVFQQNTLFDWLTVRKNIEYPLSISQIHKKESRRKTDEWLSRTGLVADSKKQISEISGGMAQRVAIARALIREPNLLLLDEPFGSLDELSRQDLGLMLREFLSDVSPTTILVTHSVDEAILLGDRVLVLSNQPTKLLLDLLIPSQGSRGPEFYFDPMFISARAEILQTLQRDKTTSVNPIYQNPSP
jgi:ABC-type nitrate/sulfonate/bicarbonate transport system ATPase subunit